VKVDTRTSPDLARAENAIRTRGGALGTPLRVLTETTSTNDEAKHGAKRGEPHGATWVAESQTDGRGRQGRAWFSPRGENLLFSVLLRVTCAPSRLPPLALVAGLAARDAAAKALGGAAEPKLKWPNDVVVGKKKLAGVLVESIVSGSRVEAVIVGIGMNVHTRAFPAELADRATSLALLGGGGGASLDRAEILADVLAALDRDVALVCARGLGLVHARLTAADALLGARVGGELGEGIAQGIDTDGRLVVKGDDGVIRRWAAGEVHLVPER
jgi:BirA family transcriptional regulator, biotin operon repressor / biotin---[acetyl-CoA-carboxylase] ligase